MPRAGSIAWIVTAAAVGMAAGATLRGGERAGRDTHTEVTRVVAGDSGAGPSLDDIRAVVREELARRGAPAVAAPEPAPEPAADAPAPPPAVAEGEHRLDEALAAGVWRNEDRAALIRVLPELPAADRDRLLTRMSAAANDGTLRIATDGPPL